MSALAALVLAAGLQADGGCEPLAELVKKTYDFVPAKLPDGERKAKFAAMDAVWELVRSDRARFVPCLRELLAAPDAQAWFLCDGSALLSEVEPTRASLELQTRLWSHTALDLVDLEPFTWTLAKLGTQDQDVSAGGEAWLRAGERTFHVARHDLTVGREAAALLVYGSMPEELATPALARIARDGAHPGRALATSTLAELATAEALAELRTLDLSGLPAETRAEVERLCKRGPTLKPRSGGVRRETLVEALQAFTAGDVEPWVELQLADEHWYEHLARSLKPEDLPLLRRMRRERLLALSDEALGEYLGYARVLWSFEWKALPR